MIYSTTVQTLEHINGATVRHAWTKIAAGVAAGKSYLVENHGSPEALIVAPGAQVAAAGDDLDAHFDRVQAKAPQPLSLLEIPRSPEA